MKNRHYLTNDKVLECFIKGERGNTTSLYSDGVILSFFGRSCFTQIAKRLSQTEIVLAKTIPSGRPLEKHIETLKEKASSYNIVVR